MGKSSWFRVITVGIVLLFLSAGLILADRRGEEVADPFEVERSLRDDSGPYIPTEPATPMSESQEIYIYVTLRQPECAGPPDSIEISAVSSPGDPEQLQLKASRNPVGSQWFNIYRDTRPMFWITSIGDTNRLPDITTSRFFTDFFLDPIGLLEPGLYDCEVNYFYVMTSGDTLVTGDTCESAYPSNCAGEFDFCICEGPSTNINFVTYAVTDGAIEASGRDPAVFGGSFGGTSGDPGCTAVRRWNGNAQIWENVAVWVTVPFPRWSVPAGMVIELLHPYLVNGPGMDPIWSLQIPGKVPPDPHFTLYRHPTGTSLNMVSLPFMEQQIAEIETGEDLGNDISGCVAIREWDCDAQIWVNVAVYTLVPFPRWINYRNVRAGYPYFVSMGPDAPPTLEWPPLR